MEDPANFQNKLICLDDAIRLTKTYMEGDKRTPEVPGLGLAQADDSKGEVTLRNDQQTCPVVAMFAMDASVKEDALFEFRVRDYSEPTPLMHCD
ncbi:hypothetical protein CA267_018655 [Alteromonas pelagimontana]|uniref:Uncharacterized protein n=1 Tax=Alteromonas pelagimontana TaxID=1858656 RepID=A0A6M4MI80_9ALTE|nr:hypothetical protein [Alteromonas pelagimontana]QJR82628.1 hypothetical protein CA267_018655 [Alteromonas pelagimontana]